METTDDEKSIKETLFLQSIVGLVEKIKSSESETLESMIDADDLDW